MATAQYSLPLVQHSINDLYDYADDIISNRIVACKYIKMAVERFIRDLERADRNLPDFPYVFSPERASIVLDFFGYCRLIKGADAGKPMHLQPWQVFFLGNIFGWVHRETGYRRFRFAQLWVGRKNGKTTILAPVGLYMTGFDGEAGAEVYCGATGEQQARILFRVACQMVKKSGTLKDHLRPMADEISQDSTASLMQPIHARSETLDGLDSHCNILDELHAHKDRLVYDTLATGMGAREQPLQVSISTAGFDVTNVGFEEWNYLAQILEQGIHDDNTFGLIYCLDKNDDKWDPRNWIKANPNLGISVKKADMHALAAKARSIPSAKSSYFTKRLNVWTQTEDRWIDMDLWDECREDYKIEDYFGYRVFMGLDLSQRQDLTSSVIIIPPQKDLTRTIFHAFAYIPQKMVLEKSSTDRRPYDVWVDEKHMKTTPGHTITPQTIIDDILWAHENFELAELGYDPYNASMLIQELEKHGVTCVEVRQGLATMSAPSKEFERLYMSQELMHNGNPVFRWCCRNAICRTDHNANYMVSKKLSTEKVDVTVAAIIGLSRLEADDGGFMDEELLVGA